MLEAINDGYINVELGKDRDYGPKTLFNYFNFILQNAGYNQTPQEIRYGGGENELTRVRDGVNNLSGVLHNRGVQNIPTEMICEVLEKIVEEGRNVNLLDFIDEKLVSHNVRMVVTADKMPER